MAIVGKQLGPYEILGVVGSGGMGVVYRARDTRLDRQVAIKVLPPDIASSDTAIARFEREARAVAAISHPNILAIHDFGREDTSAFAVMEFLDGGTLRAMVEAGPISVRKAVTLGVQIAQGLAAAHDRNIVHRDLKPENVGLMRNGQVKILDFGLAREALRQTGPDAPTGNFLSDPGMVLGTVGYMSPEQVRGHEVDHRSDLFSFGVVFYEMLTGRRAFTRPTAAETLTAILNDEPQDLVDSGAKVPPALDRVIRRCLEKHPEDRFHSARDLAFALENALTGHGSAAMLPVGRRPWRRLAAAGIIATAVAAGAGLGYLWRPAAGPPVSVRQLTLSGVDGEPAALADGSLVAYTSTRSGRSEIFWRELAKGTEDVMTLGHRPRFFADGDSLFLRSEGEEEHAFLLPRVGRPLADPLVSNVVEADPSPNGQAIAFVRLGAEADGKKRFATLGVLDRATKQERTLLTAADAELASVRFSPDGRWIAAVKLATVGGKTEIVVVDSATGQAHGTLPAPDPGAYGALAWNGDGRSLIVTRSEDAHVYVPGSPASIELIQIDSGRRQALFFAPSLFGLFGTADANGGVDVLGDGQLVFSTVEAHQTLREVSLGAKAAPARKGAGTIGNSHDRQPAYSPDGQFVIFSSNRSGNLDLWVQATGTGDVWQLTNDPAQDWDPAFTPDGKHVLWSCNRPTGATDSQPHLEIWMADFNSAALVEGPARRIAREAGRGAEFALSHPHPVTADGVDAENPGMARGSDWIVYSSGNPAHPGIWKIKSNGSAATRIVTGTFWVPDVSPDGRYAAYLFTDRSQLQDTIHVVDLERGVVDPAFTIAVKYRESESSADVTWGRARWKDAKSIVFIGQDEEGRSGVYEQAFAPGQDTTTTRRAIVDSRQDAAIESLGVSPDGWITVSDRYDSRSLMRADNVLGVVARKTQK